MIINQETIQEIKEKANEEIEFVLSELGFDINEMHYHGNYISGKCIVHGGDNDSAFSYHTDKMIWSCFTAGCCTGNKSIFGLISKILSKEKNRDINFPESVRWLANILGIQIDHSVEIDPNTKKINELLKETKFHKIINDRIQASASKETFKPVSYQQLKDKIEPSWYFLEKGFKPEILKKFGVGYCNNPQKPMNLRSFAVVLNEDGNTVLGTTGRIKYEKCDICHLFHEPNKGCPTDDKRIRSYAKWMHWGFASAQVLYNSWNAAEYIKQTKVAILTEGPKDVWWLEQNGIHNSCCIFGLNISEYHISKLIQMGALRIIIALNNDERGLDAIEKLTPILDNYFKVVNMSHLFDKYKDLAEMPPQYIEDKIKPFLNSLEYKLT